MASARRARASHSARERDECATNAEPNRGIHERSEDYDDPFRGSRFVNAAVCDEAYIPTHHPIVVEHTLEAGFTVLSGPKKKLLKDRRAAPLW